MNDTIIERWNERVNPEDTIFHIGDFAFREKGNKKGITSLLKQLNGNKILLSGNHDLHNQSRIIINDATITLAGKTFQLIHDPKQSAPWYYLVLCGHVHTAWKFHTITSCEVKIDVCNVGVDAWSYYPISIETILNEYKKWKKDTEKEFQSFESKYGIKDLRG